MSEARYVDHRCPSCGRGGVACVVKESATGSRCCPDCETHTVQRPVHVWEKR